MKKRSCKFVRDGILSGLPALLLVGCAATGLNEGAVDYRFGKLEDGDKSKARFEARYFRPGSFPEIPIAANQSVSVTLMQAFVCDFRESSRSDLGSDGVAEHPCPASVAGENSDTSRASTRGEILVVANVFERDASKIIGFDPADTKENGRVVFYSNDVRESAQYLNLSNLPVYGPITYSGRPLYLSFTILELDNEENKQTQALLGSLASIGGKAYPPAAPILGVLNSLGGALLAGDQDDVEFRYHMVLDPMGGHKNIQVPVLMPGYYVFIRSEDRTVPIDWNAVTLNGRTGRLQRCTDDGGATQCSDFRDATYLSIAINTFQKSFDLDSGQSVAAFLQRQGSFSSANLDAFLAEARGVGSSLEQMRSFSTARSSLDSIRSADSMIGLSEEEKQKIKQEQALKFAGTTLPRPAFRRYRGAALSGAFASFKVFHVWLASG